MKHLVWLLVAACGSSSPPPAQTPPPHTHAADHMHHRFEHAEQWAPIFDDPQRDAWQKPDAVVAAMKIAPGMAVADIGAGTGYFESRLAAATGADGAVIAVDVEPDMIRYLRDRAHREHTPTVEARLATADDPKLSPGSVDRILIVDTWHHVGERVAYGKKLAAALKPGGAIFIVDFTLASDKGPPKQHRIPPERVIEELTQAGLKAAVVDAGLPDQYVVAAELR